MIKFELNSIYRICSFIHIGVRVELWMWKGEEDTLKTLSFLSNVGSSSLINEFFQGKLWIRILKSHKILLMRSSKV